MISIYFLYAFCRVYRTLYDLAWVQRLRTYILTLLVLIHGSPHGSGICSLSGTTELRDVTVIVIPHLRMGPLFGAYDLQIEDAHLPSEKIKSHLRRSACRPGRRTNLLEFLVNCLGYFGVDRDQSSHALKQPRLSDLSPLNHRVPSVHYCFARNELWWRLSQSVFDKSQLGIICAVHITACLSRNSVVEGRREFLDRNAL